MMRKIPRWQTSVGILAMLSAAFAHGQQQLLTGDTQINSAAATTNYGSSPTLTVSSTNSALLQFNLANYLPTGTTTAQVLKARLIVFPDAIIKSGIVSVSQVTGAWAEGSVTYATRPSTAAAVTCTLSIGVGDAFTIAI